MKSTGTCSTFRSSSTPAPRASNASSSFVTWALKPCSRTDGAARCVVLCRFNYPRAEELAPWFSKGPEHGRRRIRSSHPTCPHARRADRSGQGLPLTSTLSRREREKPAPPINGTCSSFQAQPKSQTRVVVAPSSLVLLSPQATAQHLLRGSLTGSSGDVDAGPGGQRRRGLIGAQLYRSYLVKSV